MNEKRAREMERERAKKGSFYECTDKTDGKSIMCATVSLITSHFVSALRINILLYFFLQIEKTNKQ